MAKASEWSSRVAAWRTSGQTSEEFCKGRDFTPGGLRHWAHRLGKTRSYTRRNAPVIASAAPVRLARVVRIPASETRHRAPVAGAVALTVELGSARILVPPGFDRATFAAVLDVLGVPGGNR